VTELAPIARLAAEPRRFRFDAAVRLLLHAARTARPEAAIRFRTLPGLGFPPAEVMAFLPAEGERRAELTVAHMSLAGPMGVLPRFYTEVLGDTLRGRSGALQDFLDLLTEPLLAAFAEAGNKYRIHLATERAQLAGRAESDPMGEALLAFTGFGLARMADRLAAGRAPLLHYCGLFAERTRSAERLAALATDWLGRKVEVVQFAGGWLTLPPTEQTRLVGGRGLGGWNQLGRDAAIGVRAWDPHARVVLRIGPLDRVAFEAMLPDQPALGRFVSLIRAFLGFEVGFAVNLLLARAEVPALRLDRAATPAPRLGWNTWLPEVGLPEAGLSTRGPAADALFEAQVVEAATGGMG
jgi:type VI secretion system protein ImpH